MKTIFLTGMSEDDLNSRQWDWQTRGANKKIIKQWSDERLPVRMRSPMPTMKLMPAGDQFSRKIDFEEA